MHHVPQSLTITPPSPLLRQESDGGRRVPHALPHCNCVAFSTPSPLNLCNISVEGANALMLDIDFGTYPYVPPPSPTAFF